MTETHCSTQQAIVPSNKPNPRPNPAQKLHFESATQTLTNASCETFAGVSVICRDNWVSTNQTIAVNLLPGKLQQRCRRHTFSELETVRSMTARLFTLARTSHSDRECGIQVLGGRLAVQIPAVLLKHVAQRLTKLQATRTRHAHSIARTMRA